MSKKATNQISAKQSKFLGAFRECGVQAHAAHIAGIHPATVCDWRNTKPEFEKAFQEAKEFAIATLEVEARRRAQAGLRKVKFHKGQPIMVPTGKVLKDSKTGDEYPEFIPYVEHEYSDVLLMFLLKGAKPDIYRDNVKQEITGGINVNVTGDASALPTREELQARLASRAGILPAASSNGHASNGHSNGHSNGNGKH